MLRGLATISYFAEDIPARGQWYRHVLGVDPCFQRPEEGPAAYVEFRVGDHQTELGLVDRRWTRHQGDVPAGPTRTPGGSRSSP